MYLVMWFLPFVYMYLSMKILFFLSVTNSYYLIWTSIHLMEVKSIHFVGRYFVGNQQAADFPASPSPDRALLS